MKEKGRDQWFFLFGQMLKLLGHLHRRILRRVSFTIEDDWDSLRSFDFLGTKFLTNQQFMVTTSFKDGALTVVKSQTDVERSGKKRVRSRSYLCC